MLHDDTADLHINVIMQEWQAKSSDLVRQDMPNLLGRLADLGFAWRDIARLIGVSVPAVQKWRRGGTATGQSRFHAAAVLAACFLISEHYLVQDIASWFEAPIVFGFRVTALDLYAARNHNSCSSWPLAMLILSKFCPASIRTGGDLSERLRDFRS